MSGVVVEHKESIVLAVSLDKKALVDQRFVGKVDTPPVPAHHHNGLVEQIHEEQAHEGVAPDQVAHSVEECIEHDQLCVYVWR